eukprot:scaffold3126_cov136-Amphora_coffeaeformis.AAC.3
MGNVLSEEQAEETFLKEGFNLESPDADKEINYGASVPRCQPKHTDEEEKKQAEKNAADTTTTTMAVPPEEEVELDKNGKPKLSYIQMARMGYQELVNAIIRPPRADYKVCYWWGVCHFNRLKKMTHARSSRVHAMDKSPLTHN